MNRNVERLYNGLVKENPTFVQMLGMCPTLAVTTSAINGIGMGIATTAVLIMSNLMISMLRKVIPDKVRIPAYIVIIASFVTIVGLIMQAYVPALYESLGVFIPLIVVNCIILGRAEAYASKNPVIPSVFDGLGMGLGFTMGLTIIAVIRELIGSGTVFGYTVTAELFEPVAIFAANPGAFFVLAFIVAFINRRGICKAKKTGEKPVTDTITDCAHCGNLMCRGRMAALSDAGLKPVSEGEQENAPAEKAPAKEEAVTYGQENMQEGTKPIQGNLNNMNIDSEGNTEELKSDAGSGSENNESEVDE